MKDLTVAIVGSGTMGQAVAKGLLDSGMPPARIFATAKSAATRDEVRANLGVNVVDDNPSAAKVADVLILCTKPKDVLKVAQEIAPSLKPNALVVSIAAGVALADIEEALAGPDPRAVIRAMPNTPCSIQRGVTVLSPSEKVSGAQLEAAKAIFDCMGRTYVLDEQHMDTVTGLSASGPAFVFVMIESFADGAVARGLPRKIAIEMAAQMVLGAASMVVASGRHPAALKDDVTTPAGCTIAGLLALEDGRIRSVISRAIEVASQRAGELGGKKG